MLVTRGDGDDFIFRGFNGRFVITSPEKTVPGPTFISYAQFSKYLVLWFSASLWLSPKEFLHSTALNPGVAGLLRQLLMMECLWSYGANTGTGSP